MKLASLLNKDLIFWNIEVKNHEELYKLIADSVSEKFDLKSDDIFNAFIKRDKLGYTILPHGISIPHGRLENFNDLILAIVKLKTPFDINNEKVDLFFILLTSNIGSNLYLKSLSAFARVARDYGENLKEFSNKSDFYSFLEETNIKVNKMVLVKDIITKNPITVSLDEKLVNVVDLMRQNNITYVIVTDENNKYMGKIDLLDILKIAYPEYILSLNDLSFLSNLRAYEEFAEKEKIMLVRDVYIKDNKQTINENNNLIELGFNLLKNHLNHITVIDDENCVTGILSLGNILDNILRV